MAWHGIEAEAAVASATAAADDEWEAMVVEEVAASHERCARPPSAAARWRPALVLLAAVALTGVAATSMPGASSSVPRPSRASPQHILLAAATAAGDEGHVACVANSDDCRQSRCCQDVTSTCFEKNEGWAICAFECEPGIHQEDAEEFRTSWTCDILLPNGRKVPYAFDARQDEAPTTKTYGAAKESTGEEAKAPYPDTSLYDKSVREKHARERRWAEEAELEEGTNSLVN